ncbi:hypothetical protein MXB_4861, partial [Myxobolus squamalis]
NRKDTRYQDWKSSLITDRERLNPILDVIIITYENFSNDFPGPLIEPYLYCCLCSFTWVFEDSPKTILLLKGFEYLLTHRSKSVSYEFALILHDFIIKKIHFACSSSKLLGFSDESQFHYINTLFHLCRILQINTDLFLYIVTFKCLGRDCMSNLEGYIIYGQVFSS